MREVEGVLAKIGDKAEMLIAPAAKETIRSSAPSCKTI
jgi:hypothetical protein